MADGAAADWKEALLQADLGYLYLKGFFWYLFLIMGGLCVHGRVLAGARDIGSPWSWRYRYLWVLGTEFSPSARAVSAFNC